MKTPMNLAIVAVLGLTLTSSALAQGRPDGGGRGRGGPGGPGGHGGPGGGRGPRSEEVQPRGNPEMAVEHLTAAYATVAPFDANKDGQLDDSERAALVQAIADGKVTPPAHRTPPEGVTPRPEMILRRISGMYGQVARFDADKNGQLDETERGALEAAIASGELPRPGRGGRPGGRPGGPRHGRDGAEN